MREIKFRGKATVPHEDMGWVYGSLVIGPIFNSIHFTTNKGPQSVLVDWRGIGQYTGLKDKNGVEIFEGDVVEADCGDNGFMVGVVCYWHKTGAYMMWTDTETGFMLGVRENRVIGNVFDNPELKERFWTVWNQENNEKRNK